MINDASVVIGGGNWGIKETDVLGYRLINNNYYAREIDFANSTAAGTYTNSTGLVRKAPYNLFTQSVWTGGGLNVAPTGWSQSQTTGNFEPQTAINGSVPYRFYGTAGRRFLFQSLSVITGQEFRLSVFVNSVAVSTTLSGMFQVTGVTFSNVKYYVNNVEVLDTTLITANTRIALSFTVTSTGTATYRVGGGSASAATYDYVISQPQIVEGTSALNYFPTTNRLNVPRIDYRNADGSISTAGRLLLEPQRTNSIRNSSMVGAVAGTPGTLPTNWLNSVTAGLTRTIVGTGTENGLPYVDIRFNGTANALSARIDFEGSTNIAALTAQVWTNSIYSKIVSQPNPAVSYALQMLERTSGGGFVTDGSQIFTPTTSLQSFAFTRTLNGGATVANVQPCITINLTNGATYDFTIRIAAPQMELGAFATTWVPTTNATVTRNADTASRTGVSSWIGQTQGTIFAEINLAKLLGIQSRYILVISDNTANNRIYIGFSGASSNVLRARIFSGGVQQTSIDTGTISSLGTYKLAFAYNNNDAVLYVNGVQIGTDTSVTIPACSQLNVCTNQSGASPFADGINQAAIFTTRLTNSQLQSLTTI